MNWGKHIILLLILETVSLYAFAQDHATTQGKITDKNNKPLEAVTIAVLGSSEGTSTDKDGKFELEVPAGKDILIVVSYLGFKTERVQVNLNPGEKFEFNKALEVTSTSIAGITVEDEQSRSKSLTRIDPKTITVLPSASGGVEAILKTLPGVHSNNELSSQYSVRGGNFDENLVYVNDIEIYRPFLVRSGQQEGLSFVNTDMVSSILFSAGGFDAKYGDKMSSVLDITYRKPSKFASTVSTSLLGGSGHIEGVSKGYRLTYQLGIRQKSNQYLLGALETKGDYRPSFTDVQTFLTYDVSDKFELNFLGNISRNKFRMVPQNRQTDFGHVNEALRLTVYFDGQEIDEFTTYMGAFSGILRPDKNLTLKFITSAFRSVETEDFDIQGEYRIDELEKDFAKEDFGEVSFNRGIGTYLIHARNQLKANVFNAEHKGYLNIDNRSLLWGAKFQTETINDKLSEWKMIDSAFFSIPHNPDEIILQDVIKTNIALSSNRYSGYLQNSWSFGDTVDYTLTAGIRAHYWGLNNQLVVSPRITFSARPDWEKDFLFRASAGYYHQPPFYRELRGLNGNINTNLKAQESIHFVLGSDYNFKAWSRPFKFVSEIFYKHLQNLVPYELDNVRIRYYADNIAKGYATGIDLKVNGEFVTGIESWASLSVMQTEEDILNDFYYEYYNAEGKKIIPGYTLDAVAVDSTRFEPEYLPRLTDQRIMFGLFFQDYLPRLPDFKMHLNLLYGSRLPFGPPTYERYKDTLRMPTYRRVDIGFSYQIISESKRPKEKSPFRHLKDLWVSAEVFNLLQVNNTISYLWIKDVTNRLYAVPNYLTPRLLNIKLVAKF